MTDQEIFNILQKRLGDAGEKFMKADELLTNEPNFVNAEVLAEYMSAKKEWQLASNDYHTFLCTKIAEDKAK